MELSSTTRGIILFGVLLVVVFLPETGAKKRPFLASPWKLAHVTYYGNLDGSGTYDGACGYVDDQKRVYGMETAALSTVLYNNGAACGGCYELRCVNDPGCTPGSPSVLITATNLCPDGGWCGLPKEHFDLSMPAFLKIAQQKAGIVPVQYRRVPCNREGGIRFTITTKSNPYFLLVLVWNVGGAGDVTEVLIKGSTGKPFIPMKRNYGQNWEADEYLVGQRLTFRVRASDRRTSTSWRVTPADWQIGQTYVGKNFR